jgi:hypothetical protein
MLLQTPFLAQVRDNALLPAQGQVGNGFARGMLRRYNALSFAIRSTDSKALEHSRRAGRIEVAE